ncbi:Orotate phosphoribosyltransferase [Candidatus Roizmanbacteria bacterium]|nr:Orotate phosphoribosyltransferase [Candidatus Roizmanbacteria bacterium]
MDNVVNILKTVGAVITDSHFVYTSGKHGSVYVNKDAVYPHTAETSRIGELFAEKFKDVNIDVVAAPALGGIILSQWVAYHLSKLKGKEILGVYTEKTPDKQMIFTRGYDKLVKGKNVLVIEDLTTTGGSVRKVVDTVKAAGGNVVAVCVMVNRDPEKVTSEVVGGPFSALGVIKASAFDEVDCPLCKENVSINTNVGHGKKYLEAKGAK